MRRQCPLSGVKRTLWQTPPLVIPPSASETTARRKLLAVDANRYVLLVLQEWKSDTYITTALIYNVSLEVLGPGGAQLADTTLRGKDNLGAGLVPADARTAVETAVRQKLEAAFNDPEIVAALK